MAILFFLLYLIFTLTVLYRSINPIVWDIGSAIYLFLAIFYFGMPLILSGFISLIILLAVVILHIDSVREEIANLLFKRAVKSMPKLSKTEEEALNAGDTWFEKDIFTGNIDWQKLENTKTELSKEEQSFLDNEVEKLCLLLNEWEIKQENDLPPKVWEYLKKEGFFGLVIDKEYGGKGFSPRAHSDIVVKISSRSGVAGVTVMVPNSLGPGELLQHYGTSEQKSYYLPRLAKGIDIPCFALTEPNAGSDATSIKSEAIVMEKKVAGKTILGLMLKLNKRWITLSPVATLIGLAVQLKDPEGLLKGVGKEGITCLLISRDAKNLEIGNRHLPADQPFMNGTIRGENIFVPITSIIGGQEQAGHGWQMLVECLSIGRSVSLPALGASSSSVAYITAGAFARIRRQFNVEIAQFEGIQEKLSEIAGLNYLVNAARLLTVAAVNEHKKPSVVSAITKYFNTELARIIINDAMDVHGGRAVVVGPRNYLMNFYQGFPISVTVEGANIMTRNLLIFGQGSMACHPFIRDEFYAITSQDKKLFNKLIWQHVGYFMKNFAKAFSSAWTGGILISAPDSALHVEYQRFTRLSYSYAFLADLALIYLGGALKRKERMSARLADGLSYLYLAMSALNYCKQNNEHEDDLLHTSWAVSYCFYHAQKSLLAFCRNFPSRPIGFLLRILLFPYGQSMRLPSDKLDNKLAKLMTQNNNYRNSMIKSLYLSGNSEEPIDRMENALQLIIKNSELYKKISDLKGFSFSGLKEKLEERVKTGELTDLEMNELVKVEQARWDAIQVDEFTFDSMKKKLFSSVVDDKDEF